MGLGNIAGVAVAVSLGGAGATFWMMVCGLLGMSSKFVECTLGVKYRSILPDGRVFGGPMNYLRYGLEKRNLTGLGKVLAGLFAVLCVGASFGGGNMFQANQSFEQTTKSTRYIGEFIIHMFHEPVLEHKEYLIDAQRVLTDLHDDVHG